MGLTITSVWRLLVFDIENVLDGVRHPPLHTAHSTSSWWSVSLGRISTRTPCVAASLYRSAQACWDLPDCCDSCHSMLAAVWAPASSLASIVRPGPTAGVRHGAGGQDGEPRHAKAAR